MAGYDGYSMSNNARAAYENGKQCAATEIREVDDDAWNAICEFLDNLESSTPIEPDEDDPAWDAWKTAWIQGAIC